MADGEKRADVAKAVIDHALDLTAASLAERMHPRLNIMTRRRVIGEFGAAHHVNPGEGQIIDVWHGHKVFSARQDIGTESWKIVNFKRGDWESGFLCAA